jgi:hypothetical protein
VHLFSFINFCLLPRKMCDTLYQDMFWASKKKKMINLLYGGMGSKLQRAGGRMQMAWQGHEAGPQLGVAPRSKG